MIEIRRLFPASIEQAISQHVNLKWDILQEIRIRVGQPIELIFDDGYISIKNPIPAANDAKHIMNKLSAFSLYRMEEELRHGYVTIEGGHRVGLAGSVNTIDGYVKAIQHVMFFNIRIAKEKKGCALPVLPHLYNQGLYKNTLLIGPPQTGKTTLLRDLTRLISTGWSDTAAQKVAVIDERSELGGAIKGIPQHDLGFRTDLLDACPKAEGMMMVIRSMSPDVLVVDEIGSDADVKALMEALNAGVSVICSIHGYTLEDIKKRPSLNTLFNQSVFERFIVLNRHHQPGKVGAILDQQEQNVVVQKRCSEHDVDWRDSFNRHHNIGRFRRQSPAARKAKTYSTT
ncbi:Stage III sporulation protein AA [Lentibacillus sp. JNUCC-1]|uniref:stage III sporulation protein AA n=1 Tax=Lentibacillus sp. JNUCC-1 TaxID=2654513 RepID=UPI0012E7FD85|nr:stage III sporulation protein AA [Lentibacillus sp. JNUCC-1]MUV39668.1 Stage III sporulation protein AA [Lentibacillus sp. JNUCC-1]